MQATQMQLASAACLYCLLLSYRKHSYMYNDGKCTVAAKLCAPRYKESVCMGKSCSGACLPLLVLVVVDGYHNESSH